MHPLYMRVCIVAYRTSWNRIHSSFFRWGMWYSHPNQDGGILVLSWGDHLEAERPNPDPKPL